MANLEQLEVILRDVEEDIRETMEEIHRQRDVVRQIHNPFERKYAEHVLATYENQRSEALVQHEEIARDIADRKRGKRARK
jgi:predicted  nucleic acid-binding Zn-ribbon protein